MSLLLQQPDPSGISSPWCSFPVLCKSWVVALRGGELGGPSVGRAPVGSTRCGSGGGVVAWEGWAMGWRCLRGKDGQWNGGGWPGGMGNGLEMVVVERMGMVWRWLARRDQQKAGDSSGGRDGQQAVGDLVGGMGNGMEMVDLEGWATGQRCLSWKDRQLSGGGCNERDRRGCGGRNRQWDTGG